MTKPSHFKPHSSPYLSDSQIKENETWAEAHRQWNIANPTPSCAIEYLKGFCPSGAMPPQPVI